MRIRWHGMLGTQHSWSYVSQYLTRAMLKISDHDIFLKSTNSLEHFPDDLKHLLIPGYHASLTQGPADYWTKDGELIKVDPKQPLPETPDPNGGNYDLELAYTIFYQGPRRFFPQSKCKAVIWNFESSILPPGWRYYARAVDYILPSSQFSYDIFADNGIPKDQMLVVPHGVDTNMFNPDIPPFELKTKKKVKFLHNAIPHHRKLHERVIKGYLDTFTGNDDVCLVLKTKIKAPDRDKPFEVDIRAILEREFKGRKNPPEIEVINSYVPDIGALYTACDAVISMSATEGFNLTGIEALACGSLVIFPRHGGQLDYLNDNNSLLINTGEMPAPASMQYWVADPNAIVGNPDIEHFKELLWKVYKNPEQERNRVKEAAKETVEKFSWENAAQMILDLPIPEKSKRISKKRKVLYIIPYNMAGGGEVWVKEAIAQLDRSTYEPHVALISGANPALAKLFDLHEVDGFYVNKYDKSGITFEDLLSTGRDKALKCLLESENYSIVHFYNSFGVYSVIKEAWKQGFRCRVVETAHSELSWADSMTKVAAREPFVMAISAVSNTLGRKLLKSGNKNVVVLPQQIDWNRFMTTERSTTILENMNIPTNFVVGFVGRLSPEKNIPILLQCAKLLPDVSFVIVGDGPQKGVLQKMSEGLKNVFFLGHTTNVEDFYAAFDVLFLPSLVEGMPLVILEAMAVGTPVVASDVGAISEVVTDGVSGCLVWNASGVNLFVQAINKLRDQNFWNNCSNNCRVIAKAMYEKGKNLNINTFYNMLFNEVK